MNTAQPPPPAPAPPSQPTTAPQPVSPEQQAIQDLRYSLGKSLIAANPGAKRGNKEH